MRKFTVALGSAVFLAAVALAAPAQANHDLTLHGVVTDFEKEDKGDNGFGEGDVIKMRADLFDEDGDDAGKSKSACEVTQYEGGEVQGHDSHEGHHENIEFAADCWAGFKLDGGAILSAGEITEEDFDDGVFTLAIKEGTGDYEDAEGTVDVEFLHEGGEAHSHGVNAMHAGDDHGDKDDAEHEAEPDHDDEEKSAKFVVTFHFED